jgi:ribonuclease-3
LAANSSDLLLQERLGYRFRNPALLVQALTHKSYSNEQAGASAPHSERLEFLGDAVLGLAVSSRLYNAFPHLPEGDLTRIRAEVVSERALSALGRSLELGRCLQLGRGEERTGGRDRDSLLADAFEALLGAIMCDSGFEAACCVVERLIGERLEGCARDRLGTDYKTRLQELLQARYGRTPLYVPTAAEGPDHHRRYTVEVRFEGAVIGEGQGRSKKAAEQEAARSALARLIG